MPIYQEGSAVDLAGNFGIESALSDDKNKRHEEKSMNKPAKVAVILLVLTALFAIGTLVPEHGRAAPTTSAQPVLVTNGSTQPVPVNGGVSAAQSGTWNVGINGTPKISVGNTAANPVPVFDAGGITPYQSTSGQQCVPGAAACTFTFTAAPEGTRIVITHVTAGFFLASSAAPVGILTVGTRYWAVQGIASIRTLVGQDVGQYIGGLNQDLRAYAGQASAISLRVVANWSTPYQYVTVVGYVEQCAITGCPAIVY